ncbi:MAG TPA: amidohydrolase family protein [Acidimicrobiales bacterium]|nr:amidohydrolase family protein [Acidimicrobiales bacterium]
MTNPTAGGERAMIVSADAHLSGHPEVYRPYMAAAYLPHLDALVAEDREYVGYMAKVAAFPDDVLDVVDTDGAIRSGGVEGAQDVPRRLREMDREGVAGEIMLHGTMFSTVPFFGIQNHAYPPDVRWAGIQAYHRWAADCMAEAGGRLFAVADPGPCLDMAATLAEVAWMADRGFRSISVPGVVFDPDLPPLMDPYYEPFWEACAERGIVLSVHAGHGRPQGEFFEFMRGLIERMPDAGTDEIHAQLHLADDAPFAFDVRPRQVLWQLMLGGVFDRHPGLRLAMTEVRGDWLPDTLAYLDRRFDAAGAPVELKPSEYWRRNCFSALSFVHRSEIEMRSRIGVDTLMFGRDYPHIEGTWPNTVDWLRLAFDGVGADDARRILGENAVRCYGLDRELFAAVAAEVGPPLDHLLGGADDVSPAIVANLDLRGGYGKPAEEVRVELIARHVDRDLGLVAGAPA